MTFWIVLEAVAVVMLIAFGLLAWRERRPGSRKMAYGLRCLLAGGWVLLIAVRLATHHY